jgi:hypothetical protein
MVTTRNRRRYKLHYNLRKKGIRIQTSERTVVVNFTQAEENLPNGATELRDKFGYSIQMEIE